MNIRFLGAHNLETPGSQFVCFLIDGILAVDAGALSSNLSFEELQKLKALLLTHQHYDHIRDIPSIALSLFFHDSTIDIYSNRAAYDAISDHLLNETVYPKFLELPETNPTVKITVLEPYKPVNIQNYSVVAVPVNHDEGAFGYQITSPAGKTLFYTGDTGAGLSECWQYIAPQLLIIEVTMSDSHQSFADATGHLTPGLLEEELRNFHELKGYLPQVVLVHMSPILENEIKAEVEAVADTLNTTITLAHEGMNLQF